MVHLRRQPRNVQQIAVPQRRQPELPMPSSLAVLRFQTPSPSNGPGDMAV
jgi:hypothetical protein